MSVASAGIAVGIVAGDGTSDGSMLPRPAPRNFQMGKGRLHVQGRITATAPSLPSRRRTTVDQDTPIRSSPRRIDVSNCPSGSASTTLSGASCAGRPRRAVRARRGAERQLRRQGERQGNFGASSHGSRRSAPAVGLAKVAAAQSWPPAGRPGRLGTRPRIAFRHPGDDPAGRLAALSLEPLRCGALAPDPNPAALRV
jgi:hypothetical protein